MLSQTELRAHLVRHQSGFGITSVHLGSRFSEERTHKRGSAKHLGISPSLFEDRCSIQLGYGRVAQSESKVFYGVRRTLFDFEIEHSAMRYRVEAATKEASGRLDS